MKRNIYNPVLKDTVTFTKTSPESAGAVIELEATVMPGASSPLHFHSTYDETIAAVEGTIRLLLGQGKIIDLAAGDAFTIHAGQGSQGQQAGPTRSGEMSLDRTSCRIPEAFLCKGVLRRRSQHAFIWNYAYFSSSTSQTPCRYKLPCSPSTSSYCGWCLLSFDD